MDIETLQSKFRQLGTTVTVMNMWRAMQTELAKEGLNAPVRTDPQADNESPITTKDVS